MRYIRLFACKRAPRPRAEAPRRARPPRRAKATPDPQARHAMPTPRAWPDYSRTAHGAQEITTRPVDGGASRDLRVQLDPHARTRLTGRLPPPTAL